MTTATQKIPSGYKQTDIGVIPTDWDVKRLGDICRYQNGTSLERYFNEDSGYKVISIGNYSTVGKYIDTGSYISFEFRGAIKKFILNKDDLTMILNDKTSTGDIIGRVLLIEESDRYVFNQRTMRLTLNAGVSPIYLYFLINSDAVHKKLARQAKPGTQIYFNTADILDFRVFYPTDKAEQTAITTVISDTDELVEGLKKLIEKKKNIKQGAMQELLTGKRRLPGFSGKWEMKKLGEVAEFDHGRDLPKSDLSEDGPYKCIHYGQLFNEYKELISEIKSRTHTNTGRFYSKANDVLVPTSDVTPRGLATASCIKEDGVILGGGILVIRLHSGYDGLYFSYFVSQNKNTVLRFVKGSTVFHLYGTDLANFEVIFPEAKEQVAIAKVLSDMDVEIEKLESQLTKYQNLKQGMMQVLLTGKIRLLSKIIWTH